MEVFDRAGALERLDGDVERLDDLLEDFQIKMPGWMSALARAAERKRPQRLAELAEELRESSMAIGAEGMAALGEQVAAAAAEPDFEKIETLITHMGMELDWLSRVLDENRCSGNL